MLDKLRFKKVRFLRLDAVPDVAVPKSHVHLSLLALTINRLFVKELLDMRKFNGEIVCSFKQKYIRCITT